MMKPWPQAERKQELSKRLMDLGLTISLLCLLSPLLLVIALLVRLKLGRPILYQQQRPGRHGRPFTILKFRTMHDACDTAGKLLPDKKRLSSFGILLRRSSLDELPELFNVLKGEMSLVGPRPLLLEYLPFYTLTENRRHEVRPGITGWAQIHGRNYLPWQERLAHDVWYIEHQSLRLDLYILWRTFWQVICREGVAADPDSAETNLHEERGNANQSGSTGELLGAPGREVQS